MTARHLIIWLAVALMSVARENERLRDELDQARTALDGIGSLVTVGRTPRRPRGELPADGP